MAHDSGDSEQDTFLTSEERVTPNPERSTRIIWRSRDRARTLPTEAEKKSGRANLEKLGAAAAAAKKVLSGELTPEQAALEVQRGVQHDGNQDEATQMPLEGFEEKDTGDSS